MQAERRRTLNNTKRNIKQNLTKSVSFYFFPQNLKLQKQVSPLGPRAKKTK